MKSDALTAYLEDCDDDEIVKIYEAPPAKMLRKFNASASQIQALIEERFPEAIEDFDDDEDDDGEDDGEDDDDDKD